MAAKPTPLAAPDKPLVIEDTRPMFANDLLERALAIQPDAAPPEQVNSQPARASAGTALPDTADQSAGSQPLPRSRMLTVHRGSGIVEAIGRKPKGHDFIIDRRHSNPAVSRHMNVTGG
ncbi:MAG: hypothetical protein VW935_07185 [Novosphingobium sp.]